MQRPSSIPISQTQAVAAPPGQRNHPEEHAYGAPLGTHRYPPLQGDPPNINHVPKNQTLKANITIATLNMNGFAAPSRNMTGIEKWSAMYQTMKENKIAVLALQETHLDDNLLHSVNKCFGKRLTIINSSLSENPRVSAGVAFVINRALVAPKDAVTTELIKGRAMALQFKWHNDDNILLINVYAPNDRNAHPAFWETIDTKCRSKGLRKLDMMLGDFNVTEELIDRAPAHLDDTDAIAALRNLRQCLSLEDSWHHTFPHDRCFTFRATNNQQAIKSRLDRIYTSENAGKASYDWKICQTSVPTDHWLVSTKYAPAHAPYIGQGQWTMQIPELKNDKLMERIIDQGMTLQTDLNAQGEEMQAENTHNPQTLWKEFKRDIVSIAKKHCHESRRNLTKKICEVKRDLNNMARNMEIDTNNNVRVNEAYLSSKLATLKHIQARDRKDDMRAVGTNHSEVLGGAWSAMNKDRKPRDLLN
ncbi:Endonuclease/exonuclease/phosphatase [Lactarius quietus]|nr:Endonuclease/exonuclease/phosphatase [Lactarius quietus]